MSVQPTKSIILYSHANGPNPRKIGILLEELKLPYKLVTKEMGDGPNGLKEPSFLETVTLNGRAPIIDDDGLIIWESGAILLYLAEKYAPDGTWHGKTIAERAIVNQWLTYQLSGIGPMLGQVIFFKNFHKNISGQEAGQDIHDRFSNEVYRIFDVLERQLARQEAKGYEYIALDRITIADLSFTAWLRLTEFAGLSFEKFPKLKAYQDKIQARETAKKANERIQAGGTDA